MKTEIIAGFKPVVTTKGERIIITTVSGAQVWAKPEHINANHDTVTFIPRKKGDKIIALADGANHKKGDTIELKADMNEFQCTGKQVAQLESFRSKMLVFQELGITPTLAM